MRRDETSPIRSAANDGPTPLGECPPGHDPSDPHRRILDARMMEMRALLARMRPASDAEALRALRSAFPDTSLSSRVAAIAAAGASRS